MATQSKKGTYNGPVKDIRMTTAAFSAAFSFMRSKEKEKVQNKKASIH
jgi:hypothetical protein